MAIPEFWLWRALDVITLITPLAVTGLAFYGRRYRSSWAGVVSRPLPWWGTLLASVGIVGGAIALFGWYHAKYLAW